MLYSIWHCSNVLTLIAKIKIKCRFISILINVLKLFNWIEGPMLLLPLTCGRIWSWTICWLTGNPIVTKLTEKLTLFFQIDPDWLNLGVGLLVIDLFFRSVSAFAASCHFIEFGIFISFFFEKPASLLLEFALFFKFAMEL